MQTNVPKPEFKSAERQAFEHYLRTGRRWAAAEAPERKFNPYHDPRNGQFTFAPGGPRSVSNPIFADRRGLWKPRHKPAGAAQLAMPVERDAPAGAPRPSGLERALPTEEQQPHQYRPNPRARMGGNGGPPLDPLMIEQAVPALQNSPAGAIIAIPDIFFNFTAPAQATIGTVHDDRVMNLIKQIEAIDPKYHYESLGPVQTRQGRINEINKLRSDRAMALYRVRGDDRAVQVEVIRFVQARVDLAYDKAVELEKKGELPPALSRRVAIGNYIDMRVRRDLQEYFNSYGIDYTKGPIRVIGRQYDTSKGEPTYVIPDNAVGRINIDWSMEAKKPGKRQIRGFFNSDLQPTMTIIIRPSQLGKNHTYIIKNPR